MDIVAAAAAVHAPQLLSRPPHEDLSKLDASTDALRDFGQILRDARPDAVLLIGLDHLETFWLDAVPPFTVVLSPEVEAKYMERQRTVRVHTDLATHLLNGVLGRDFDLTYSQSAILGHAFLTPIQYILGDLDVPIIPILVNTYMPPIPSPKRAYAFGQAIAATLADRPERIAVIASGGMSHFPGTERYEAPNYEFDRWVIQEVAAGRYDDLLDLSAVALDEVGESELMTWFTALGVIGQRPGRLLSYQELSHHGQGVIQFLPGVEAQEPTDGESLPRYAGQTLTQTDFRYYRFPRPETVPLNKLLHRIIEDADFRRLFVTDRVAALHDSGLSEAERAALLADGFDALTAAGGHPLLALSARQVAEIEHRRLSPKPA